MSSTPSPLPVSALLFLIGLGACWRLNPLGVPIQFDNQVYYYIAERAASGIPPHVSEFDPKNALSMLMTAVAIRIGRGAGVDDLMAARALSIAVTAAVLPLLWTATQRLGGSRWMAAVTVAVPLLFVDYLSLAVAGARPKVFLVFFEALWMLAAASGRPILLGVATGCCFLTWQPALLLLAAACAPALFLEGPRKAILWILQVVAGTLAPVVLYETYFLWHGAIGEQIYQSLVFPLEYGKASRPALRVARNILMLGEPFGLRALVLCSATLGVAAFWVSSLLAPWRALSFVRANPARLALVLAASGTFAFNLHDYQGFPDRLFLLPFFAIVGGIVLGSVVERAAALLPIARRSPDDVRVANRRGWVEMTALAVAGLLLIAQLPDRGGRNALKLQREASVRVGDFVRNGKSVYAIGPLHLLAMQRLSNFNRYGFFPARIAAHMTERMRHEKPLLPLLRGKLPDIVLTSRMSYAGNRRWLERYYTRKRSSAFRRQYTQLWKLNADVKPPPNAFPF